MLQFFQQLCALHTQDKLKETMVQPKFKNNFLISEKLFRIYGIVKSVTVFVWQEHPSEFLFWFDLICILMIKTYGM